MPMAPSEENIQIGSLAKQLAISTRTIRYYEEIGLMGDPDRVSGGFRSYSKKEVVRLKFILRLKELGITLNEMKDISVNYELNNQATDKILPQLVEILTNHLVNIDEKIKNLRALRKDINDYSQRIVDLLHQTGAESLLYNHEQPVV